MTPSRTWEPDFDSYPTLMHERPATVSLDLGVASQVPLVTHAARVHVRAAMKTPRDDGRMRAEERSALEAVGARLGEGLDALAEAVYVGRVVFNGAIDWVFYAPATGDLQERVAQVLEQVGTDYTLMPDLFQDADWGFYRGFLWPDPSHHQALWNRRVLRQLAAQGDDPSRVREIDHYASFEELASAQAAVEALAEAGFRVDPVQPRDVGHVVSFHHDDRLGDGRIDDIVARVSATVAAQGGAYDGWGCTVSPPDPA